MNSTEAVARGEWASSVASAAPVERWLVPVTAIVLVAIDGLMVTAAFVVAYWLRFVVTSDEASGLAFDEYVRMGATVSVLGGLVLALHGFYDPGRPRSWPTTFQTTLSGVSTGLVAAVTMSFFVGEDGFSRLWFGAGWALAVVFVFAWRMLAHPAYARIRAAVIPRRRVLIVGANQLGRELADELAARYDLIGFVDNGSDFVALDWPLLGTIAELDGLASQYAIDEIVVALPENRREQITHLITRGFTRAVQVNLVPGLSELLPHRVELSRLGDRSLLRFAPAARVGWSKRATDLVVATVLFLLAAPLLGAIALAIRLDSSGLILFRQQRLGRNGKPFEMLKFRSMIRDADRHLETLRERNEAEGPMFKIRRDPRLTRVGRLLRRLSLDELPQLINVIRGDMSLVGPRPPLPAEVAKYESWQLGRLRARPGMTGLWQVSGRSEVPFHDMVRLDLHYIRNWSLQMDVEIILRTVPAVLSNRGAY
jgi:exopolysaccharide biosynthesis polyprenyl glycosylphosphotransferase